MLTNISLFTFLGCLLSSLGFAALRPNVVFVITDDQGYGDIQVHGNPVVKTPHMNQLWAESTVLTDYHVAPTCSPTRASLLTGHWSNRTGVWHTVNGRSMLREDEVTIAQLLKDAGYQTGHFGKWHLGDNYPYRPEDRGFTEVYRHGGGGVGQTPDHWDNSYFDGSYIHNGKAVAAKGFCTDVFFGQANRFIETCTKEKTPFFAYITTNAPHAPLHCPQKYLDLYKDQPPKLAAFLGMITNIDDNLGKTRALLKKLQIEKNTIVIFTTDNGTAGGDKLFNAGMSGKKGSPLEGGHRVPFFLHWPDGGHDKHHPFGALSHAVDIVPTLLDLLNIPSTQKFDGLLLRQLSNHHDRFLITDSQRVRDPIKWRRSSVMQNRWRLIEGTKLYDIRTDPAQKKDIAQDHPRQVEKMRAFYEQWWAELEPTFAKTTEIYLGHPDHPIVDLTGHDWIQETQPPWSQSHIRGLHGHHDGHWAVKTLTSGDYQITLRRWPREVNHPITSSLPPGKNVPGSQPALRTQPGKALTTTKATLQLNGKILESKSVTSKDTHITFTTQLDKGSHQLSPFFQTKDRNIGAYYCTIEKL